MEKKMIMFQINNYIINQVIKNKEMIQILNKLKDKKINKKELKEMIKIKKI